MWMLRRTASGTGTMAISDPVDKFYICSYKSDLSSARKDTLRGFLGMPGPVDGSVFDIVDQVAEIAPGRLGTRASAGEAGKAGIFTQKRIGLNREFSLEVVLRCRTRASPQST